uniref:Uncharacterized protein n=1 Tax=Knipowitschia caucasica TaxID=637954 RepID=A0AAV2KBT3_KNICA
MKHSHSSTHPLRLSMGASSPLKSSKFPSSSASAAAKRIGRSSSGATSNLRSSRLASSLSDLYASLPAGSAPTPRLYGNRPEVNNNNSLVSGLVSAPGVGGALYAGSSVATATGKSREWAGPHRATSGVHGGLKSGRYLSRSIPVSAQQQL